MHTVLLIMYSLIPVHTVRSFDKIWYGRYVFTVWSVVYAQVQYVKRIIMIVVIQYDMIR